MKILFSLLIAVFVLMHTALALEVEDYQIEFHVVESAAVVKSEAVFSQKTTDVLRIALPSDAKGVDVYLDSKRIEPVIENKNLVIKLNENSNVQFSYASKRMIDGSNFVYNFLAHNDIKSLTVKLTLPEGAILKEEMAKSVFPQPDEITSDGRRLILIWKKAELKQGDELSIFTRYQLSRDYSFLLIPSLIAVLIALGLLYYVLSSKRLRKHRQSKKSAGIKKPAKKVKKEQYDVLKHFKEEEQQIIRILRQRDGSCEQGTLRVVTGFSKATLSRLLSELEERKIVHKEKRGKKNLIFLKEY